MLENQTDELNIEAEPSIDTVSTNAQQFKTERCSTPGQVVDRPAAEEPVIEETVIEQPVIEEPVIEEPVIVAPVIEQPVIEQPVATNKKPTKPKSENGFSSFKLGDEVLQSIKLTGYEQPTPIQSEIIPIMLEGRDLLAQSQTGTGKTAAFALPILTNIKPKLRKPQVLVLAPTRELAIQVAKSFSTYGTCVSGFSVVAIYGGQDYEPQLKRLRRGVNVVVGTPGRVIDHIKRGTLDLSGIECLVLDEADEMLNMGFLEDVEFVLKHTPKKRQIALFSATLPQPIRDIAQNYLNDPAKVTIKKKTMTADSIRQRAVFVSPREKVDLLIRFLEAENPDGVLVFTRTRETTTVVAEQLARAGLSAVALNGEMPQRTRERTIERLKSGQLNIVVATDVAARGLDVTRISHVFNYDLPEGSESYIHRVGRTGRAGRKGEAIIFLTKTQRGRLRVIEKATKQPIEIVEPPTTEQINQMRVERFKEQIADTIEKHDLGLFHKMIGDFAEQSGQPLELIAAAVAHMGQQGRSFLMQNRPPRKQRDKDGRKGKNERGERNRHFGAPEPGMNRYRIAVGRRDGVRPGNIVGAVANEAGIDGQHIGPIQIHESYSTVDLPEKMPNGVFEALQNTRVAGRQLNLRPAREDDHQQSRPRKRKGRPNESSKGKKFRGARSEKSGKTNFSKGKPGFAGKRKKQKAKT